VPGVLVSDPSNNTSTTTDESGQFSISAFLPNNKIEVELKFDGKRLGIPAAYGFNTEVSIVKNQGEFF